MGNVNGSWCTSKNQEGEPKQANDIYRNRSCEEKAVDELAVKRDPKMDVLLSELSMKIGTNGRLSKLSAVADNEKEKVSN